MMCRFFIVVPHNTGDQQGLVATQQEKTIDQLNLNKAERNAIMNDLKNKFNDLYDLPKYSKTYKILKEKLNTESDILCYKYE